MARRRPLNDATRRVVAFTGEDAVLLEAFINAFEQRAGVRVSMSTCLTSVIHEWLRENDPETAGIFEEQARGAS